MIGFFAIFIALALSISARQAEGFRADVGLQWAVEPLYTGHNQDFLLVRNSRPHSRYESVIIHPTRSTKQRSGLVPVHHFKNLLLSRTILEILPRVFPVLECFFLVYFGIQVLLGPHQSES